MEMKSLGYKKCEELIKMLKELQEKGLLQKEFDERTLKSFIAKYIGFSKLSQERYFHALITFGLIKRLENGHYGII